MSPFNNSKLQNQFNQIASLRKDYERSYMDGIEAFNADVLLMEQELGKMKLPKVLSESIEEACLPEEGDMVYLEYANGKIFFVSAYSEFDENRFDIETDFPYVVKHQLSHAPLRCRQFAQTHDMLNMLSSAVSKHFEKHLGESVKPVQKTIGEAMLLTVQEHYQQALSPEDELEAYPVILRGMMDYLSRCILPHENLPLFSVGVLNWCNECDETTSAEVGENCTECDSTGSIYAAKQVMESLYQTLSEYSESTKRIVQLQTLSRARDNLADVFDDIDPSSPIWRIYNDLSNYVQQFKEENIPCAVCEEPIHNHDAQADHVGQLHTTKDREESFSVWFDIELGIGNGLPNSTEARVHRSVIENAIKEAGMKIIGGGMGHDAMDIQVEVDGTDCVKVKNDCLKIIHGYGFQNVTAKVLSPSGKYLD